MKSAGSSSGSATNPVEVIDRPNKRRASREGERGDDNKLFQVKQKPKK